MAAEQHGNASFKRLIGWVIPVALALLTGWVAFKSRPAPAAVTPTAPPPVTIIYVTVTSTPSATLTPAATHTPRATPWPSPTPRGTATPYASRTAYPTDPPPTPFVMPSVPAGGAVLHLHKPNPDTLIHIIQLASQVDEAGFNTSNDTGIEINSAQDIQTLLTADAQRYATTGLPDASAVLHTPIALWNPWPPDSLIQLLRPAAMRSVLDHAATLLVEGGSLTDGVLHAKAQIFEVDGDPGHEWLIALNYETYAIQDWLLVNVDAQGQPQFLPVAWEPMFTGMNQVEFDATHDLTGDSLPEIVIVPYNYLFGNAWGEIYIYQWQASSWQLVGQAPLDPIGFRTGDVSNYTFADNNGDGRTDLRVTTPVNDGFGCDYTKEQHYAWDGVAVTRQGLPTQPPVTSACRLAQLSRLDDLSAQADALSRLLPALEADGTLPDYVAWARVRIAMDATRHGQLANARALLTEIAQSPAQSGYVQLVRAAVAAHGPEPLTVCADLYARAVAQGDYGSLNTAMDFELAHGTFYAPWPEMVCPLPGLTSAMFSALTFSSAQTPTEALSAASLILDQAQALQLDRDPELEWVGLLAGDTQPLLIFDQRGDVWHVNVIVDDVGRHISFSRYPLAGDTTADVLVSAALPENPNYGTLCTPALPFIRILRLAAGSAGWSAVADWRGCADPALLNISDPAIQAQALALLAAPPTAPTPEPPPSYPAWFELRDYLGTAPIGTNLSEYVSDLQANILAGNYPQATQQAITDLLNYLPADEAAAQPAIEHLLYLRGLGYELAGDEDAAVTAYAALIQKAPASLWAWLAWARVGPE